MIARVAESGRSALETLGVPLDAVTAPSCACAVVRLRAGRLEWLVLADVTVVIATESRTIMPVDRVFADYKNALMQNPQTSQAPAQVRPKLGQASTLFACATPSCSSTSRLATGRSGSNRVPVLTPPTENLPVGGGERILLASDGFAAGVELGVVPDWISLVSRDARRELSQVVADLRARERTTCAGSAVNKQSDDATALLLEIDR